MVHGQITAGSWIYIDSQGIVQGTYETFASVARRHFEGSERWRYIRYNDGAEEVYDHQTDPLEWTNLVWEPGSARVTKELASWLPRSDAANLPAEETIADREF